ncbi:3-deoxy-8-phosphooctulonate synthase [uncultured Imperialibacter sp.]|uniref:3-deoxy-8-phosphooctulonate synthase n=1 Tax=uncultured Imperialibacter sp. TaxID=1672639 RepID=UPI0030DC8127|tara:strand:+ start:9086 stop:9874 length:789 start_codon:yes stop_codon:yes gene_type:complete
METTSLYRRLNSETFVIAGPCVMESYELLRTVAKEVKRLEGKFNIPFVFKSSFDKANRTAISSFRGPGIEEGMRWMAEIKKEFDLPVTTDIHESWQAKQLGAVVDIIQIPAFLCRQTDLLVESAKTGKIVNIKKAQFLAATDMKYAVEKVKESGNDEILLTERGSIFGYGNLVVDFRNIPVMKSLGVPVVMDCTHAVQKPSGGSTTGGNREYIEPVAFSAKAFGTSGYFFEVHPDPDKGLSDGPNMYYLDKFEGLLERLLTK